MLLDTLGASLLGNLLTKKISDRGALRAWEGTTKAGYGFKKNLSPHSLRNCEIQWHYQNEPRFIGVYSRDNLPNRIRDEAYITNLDEYSDVGTHWIALYRNNKNSTYWQFWNRTYTQRSQRIST